MCVAVTTCQENDFHLIRATASTVNVLRAETAFSVAFIIHSLFLRLEVFVLFLFSPVEQELRFKRSSFKSAFKYSLDLFFIHYASLLMDNLCAHQENTKIHAEWFRQKSLKLELGQWLFSLSFFKRSALDSRKQKCKKRRKNSNSKSRNLIVFIIPSSTNYLEFSFSIFASHNFSCKQKKTSFN